MKNDKKRNWAFIIYPESAPTDWIDILQQTGLQSVISPLHNRDLNADNEPKKEHYHVIITYSGPTSYNVVKKITDKLNASMPIPLEQIRGYYRYLTHEDNPEKAQYSKSDIRTINGFNIADFIEITKSEITAIKKQLLKLILDNGITEYCELMDYLLYNDYTNEFDVASCNTIFFDRYISSKRHNTSA